MTLEISSQLTNCKNAFELWQATKDLAVASLSARVMLLKTKLQQTRKGSSKMTNYLAKMKRIADNLLLAENPVSISDLVVQILAGLDYDYNLVVCQLSKKKDLT